MNEGPTHLHSAESPRRTLGCLAILIIALCIACGRNLVLSQWQLTADGNAGVAEAVSWLHGRFDLPFKGNDPTDPESRGWDTAFYNGKVYNISAPLIGILTYILHPFHSHVLGFPEGDWSPWTFVWLLYWPLPIAGFFVFRNRLGDSAWAALLTFAWIGGTATLPNLTLTGRGLLGQMDHIMSQVGVLILINDILGRRRIWPGLVGLLITTYSRQLTFLYGFVLLWAAWKYRGPKVAALCLGGMTAIVLPLFALNYAKFDSPLDFGYRYIYVGRDDDSAVKCREFGTFSPHFFLENAYYMHLAPPEIAEVSPNSLVIRETNGYGTSLWITTPLAFFIFLSWKQWWPRPPERVVMICTFLIMAALLCYHTPGHWGHGYSRFTMDFMVVWLVVIAPFTRGKWQTNVTFACTAWSVWYFSGLNV